MQSAFRGPVVIGKRPYEHGKGNFLVLARHLSAPDGIMLAMLKLTWKQAAAWRVHRQHLDQRARSGSMLTVASRLCGLHAQVMSSAELTLWARVENLDRRAVRKALWEDRSLVKTWAMRGTLHLLPAREFPLWHAGLSASRRYLRPNAWRNYFGITMEELDTLTDAVAKALEGRVLTREELIQQVGRLTGSSELGAKLGESWGMILKPAAFTGRLCFAQSIGQRVRFTHPATWLAARDAQRIDPETAMIDISRRFLAAYGPATHRDLARWWGGGGGMTAVRKWIALLGNEVSEVSLDDAPAWMLAAHARKLRDLPMKRSVRLLPGFDQYVVAASHHAAQLLPGDLRSRVYRPQGWISPVLLVDGFMQGVWRHEIKGSHIEVVIEPFVKAPAWVRRAAGEDAERLAEFLGGSLKLAWKDCRG